MKLNHIQIVLCFVFFAGLGVQNASAYYSPKMGRFVSRDPIEYEAEDVSLYRYVHNSPTTYNDIYGERTNEEKEKCNKYIANNLDRMENILGFVLCDDGEKIICPYEAKIKEKNKNQTAIDIIIKCIEEHEQVHADDPNSTDCPKGCPARMLGITSKKAKNSGECDAYKAGRECLEKAKKSCYDIPLGSGRLACLYEVNKAISSEKAGEKKYCDLAKADKEKDP